MTNTPFNLSLSLTLLSFKLPTLCQAKCDWRRRLTKPGFGCRFVLWGIKGSWGFGRLAGFIEFFCAFTVYVKCVCAYGSCSYWSKFFFYIFLWVLFHFGLSLCLGGIYLTTFFSQLANRRMTCFKQPGSFLCRNLTRLLLAKFLLILNHYPLLLPFLKQQHRPWSSATWSGTKNNYK